MLLAEGQRGGEPHWVGILCPDRPPRRQMGGVGWEGRWGSIEQVDISVLTSWIPWPLCSAFLTVKKKKKIVSVLVKCSASHIFSNKLSHLTANPSFTKHFFNHFFPLCTDPCKVAAPQVFREGSQASEKLWQVHELLSRMLIG